MKILSHDAASIVPVGSAGNYFSTALVEVTVQARIWDSADAPSIQEDVRCQLLGATLPQGLLIVDVICSTLVTSSQSSAATTSTSHVISKGRVARVAHAQVVLLSFGSTSCRYVSGIVLDLLQPGTCRVQCARGPYTAIFHFPRSLQKKVSAGSLYLATCEGGSGFLQVKYVMGEQGMEEQGKEPSREEGDKSRSQLKWRRTYSEAGTVCLDLVQASAGNSTGGGSGKRSRQKMEDKEVEDS